MKSEVREIGPCKYAVKVEVGADRVRETIDGKYRMLADQVSLPGFRRGHAPRALLTKKYGKSVMDESKTDLVGAAFEEALKEKELIPLGEPEIDIAAIAFSEDAPLSFEATVEVRPKFDLPPYLGIEIVRPKYEVTDAEVELGIQRLRESRAQLVPATDGTIQPDDFLVADQELIVDGEVKSKQENGTFALTKDLVLFAEPRPDVIDLMKGAKVGDVREIPLKLPEKVGDPALAGKKALLKLTVRDIKRKTLPELDAAWLKELDFDTVDELKAEIRKRIDEQKAAGVDNEIEDALVTKIVDASNFPLPEGFVAKSAEDLLSRERVRAEQAGASEKDLAEIAEKGKEASRDAVIRNLKSMLLLDAIAGKERVFVTESEVDERLAQQAQRHGKWPHEIREFYEKNEMMGHLRATMREEKVRAFLRKKASIKG